MPPTPPHARPGPGSHAPINTAIFAYTHSPPPAFQSPREGTFQPIAASRPPVFPANRWLTLTLLRCYE